MTKFLIPALAVIFMASTAVIFANFHKIEPYLTLFEPTFEDKVAEAARLVEIEKCLKDQFEVKDVSELETIENDLDRGFETYIREIRVSVVQDLLSAYKDGRLEDHAEFRVLSEVKSEDITPDQADERKAFYLQCFESEESK